MSVGMLFVHATVVLLGEAGVLIEGAPGAGKSSLAAALLDLAAAQHRFGRLVGDDRVGLTAVHGRLLARPHPAIAGLLERRGLGLIPTASEPVAVVRLAVRLGEGAVERLPDEPPIRTLAGVALPLLPLRAQAGARDNAWRVAQALPLLTGCANRLAYSPAMHKIAPRDAAGGHVAGST